MIKPHYKILKILAEYLGFFKTKEMRKTSSHPGTLVSYVTDRKMQDCGAE